MRTEACIERNIFHHLRWINCVTFVRIFRNLLAAATVPLFENMKKG